MAIRAMSEKTMSALYATKRADLRTVMDGRERAIVMLISGERLLFLKIMRTECGLVTTTTLKVLDWSNH